jgi:hypothetical protein
LLLDSLVKLIESAEGAVEALAQRNVLAHQQRRATLDVNIADVLQEEEGEYDSSDCNGTRRDPQLPSTNTFAIPDQSPE